MSFKIRAEGGTRAADRDEIRRALSALADPAGWVEVFSLPSGRSTRREAGDLAGLVEAAHDLSDGSGTYYRVNPVGPGDRAANNGDVVSRRHLLVDCDPVRPDGVMATDVEKAAGIEQARAAAEFLSAHGWPDPAWVDSGSGVQLLYRIDLANDALSRQWLKAILARIGDETDTDRSKIDRGVFRANQLGKLPGTWARKGADLPDRPHRPVRLVSVPAAIEAVTTEQLGAMAGMAVGGTTDIRPKGGRPSPPPSATAPSDANGHANGHAANPWGVKATARGLDGYVRSAIQRECAVLGMTAPGGRNDALNAAAFNLGTLAAWPEMDAIGAKASLQATARQVGLAEDEIKKTLASGWDSGAAKGRRRPVEPAARKATDAAAPFDPGKRIVIFGCEVTPRKVRWLWPDRIAIGFISIFAGRTGIGKSFVLCDFAARVTIGGQLPESPIRVPQGRVLMISEDPYDYVLAPRLREMGADLDMVGFMTWEAMAAYSLGDVEMLERAYREAGDPSLIIIDPPANFLGARDEHKNAEVRQVLMGLIAWLASKDVACVFITHVNKQSGKGIEAVDRIMGSVAWASTARVAVGFAPDPNQADRCLMAGIKNNLGPKAETLAYQIEKTDTLAKVIWRGKVDTTADEAMNQTKKKSRGLCAVEWLEGRFREKREWESGELKRLASEAGVSKNALWSPEVNALPIRKRPRMDAAGDKTYYWIAEDGWPGAGKAGDEDEGIGKAPDPEYGIE